MLLTEEQARKKYCPHTTSPDGVLHCVASKCMAWRWGRRGAEVNETFDPEYPTEGYCGLARKVEE